MRIIWKILVRIEIFLFILIASLFIVNLTHNIKLEKGFVSSDKFDYLNALNDGTLKKQIFPYQINTYAMSESNIQNPLLVIPCDLEYTYYGDQLIIPRGATINIHYNETYLFPYGYGFQSYPTEKAGERAGMPFKLASESLTWKELYRIRLSELEHTLYEYYKIHRNDGSRLKKWIEFQYCSISRKTMLFEADWLLYREGIYLSPDLYWPLINTPLVITIMVLGIVMCGMYYSIRKY